MTAAEQLPENASTLKPPSSQELRRLILVRQLYEDGVERSYSEEPLSGLAILAFHDAVEMFLYICGEHVNAVFDKHAEFKSYWRALEAVGLKLPDRTRMIRLNEIRVSCKHRGIVPASSSIEEFRVLTRSFLEDSCQLAFAIDFNAISRVTLIADALIRELLSQAELAVSMGECTAALERCATAYRYVVLKDQAGLYDMSATVKSISMRRSGLDRHSGPGRALEEIGDAVSEAFTAVAYQLDYSKYRLLKTFSPIVRVRPDGGHEFEWACESTSNISIAKVCTTFVTDMALAVESRIRFL